MARLAAFLVVVAGLLSGSPAAAQLQVPTLPVPLPPTPPVPVPLPPPNLPPVTPPSPPPTSPAPPAPAPSTPNVGGTVGSLGAAAQGAVGALTGGASSSSSGGSEGGAASASGAPGSGGGVASSASGDPRRVRAAQPGIRNEGPRESRRAAVVTFVLERAAVVRFRVRQESPDCADVGSFTVRGRPGRNRIRFSGRLRGVALPPGTYSLTATAFRNGRAVRLGRTFVVVVPDGADPSRARPARSTCSGPGDGGTGGADLLAAAGAFSQSTGGSDSGGDGTASGAVSRGNGSGSDGTSGAQGATASGSLDEGESGSGALGGVIDVPPPLDEVPGWLQAFLLAALLLAMGLLLLAALPARVVRPVGAAPAVVRHRPQMVLLGAVILGAVAILALAL